MKNLKHLKSLKFYVLSVVAGLFLFAYINSFFTEAYSAFPTKATTEIKKTETPSNIETINSNASELNNVQTQEVVQSPNSIDKTDGNKSQLIALLLCIFLGGLGIHRFYLGYTWQGVVQLLTAGGCGIWWLVDLIRIATGDLKPKDGDYDETL